jgi:hypothetical protein
VSVKFPFYKDAVFKLWMSIFEAMSFEYFDVFAEALQFPLEPSKELQQIAKAYILLSLSAINVWIPETPTQIPDSKDEGYSLISAWEHTILRLESMGKAEAVYSWGRRIHHDGLRFSYLESPSILMIHWVLSPERSGASALDFDEATEKTVQLIVLRYYAENLQFRNRVLKLESRPFDEWDRFILKTRGLGNWLTNQLWLYSNMALWKEIFGYLTEAQLKVIDDWQQENISAKRPYEIPVSLFQMKRLLLS